MKVKQFKSSAKVFQALQTLAIAIQTSDASFARGYLETIRTSPVFANKKGWQKAFTKLDNVLATGKPEFTIFAEGNSKLPFIAFSTLPGVTCPGAGECLDFCYSFRAWRYPAAFCRMAQNAFLMRHHKSAIADAFTAHDSAQALPYDFRLYVDGDFSCTDDVAFWFNLISGTKAKVYGYSKSFNAILAYAGPYPSNYLLNVSGGHNSDTATVERVKALPITRGEFIAVSIGRKVKATDHGTVDTNKALRKVFSGKAFPCPGTCGSCTGKGHACGMQALKGVPIIIAMH